MNTLVKTAPNTFPVQLDDENNPRNAPLPLFPNHYENIVTHIGQPADYINPLIENKIA